MTRPHARRSASPTTSTARNGCAKTFQRRSASLGGAGATTAPTCDDEKGRAQVVKDARAVAVSLLANKRRRAVSDQVMAKVTATTLFLDTVSFKTELIKQHAFLNRVRNLLKDEDVKREARALVTEEYNLRPTKRTRERPEHASGLRISMRNTIFIIRARFRRTPHPRAVGMYAQSL
eukprot:CAMPEP_0179703574 /NCGR_PEP_ID=MMETSP0937-20121108/2868_1 /TAXON_ID=548131 ORGANISM="Ostreococcus mediterraneus, Strain clade-D-RCC2593" /NCGR_SAMPLE_ID=MMETSP0937 /ASSEMBLY_ACC=CAM_ASM_000575 /LENGTH=176 /DNA_ID=CAMNT_0021576753 /DNA_START=1337 /DNA_END=1867 /DNA_ORIENTATION=+